MEITKGSDFLAVITIVRVGDHSFNLGLAKTIEYSYTLESRRNRDILSSYA